MANVNNSAQKIAKQDNSNSLKLALYKTVRAYFGDMSFDEITAHTEQMTQFALASKDEFGDYLYDPRASSAAIKKTTQLNALLKRLNISNTNLEAVKDFFKHISIDKITLHNDDMTQFALDFQDAENKYRFDRNAVMTAIRKTSELNNFLIKLSLILSEKTGEQ